MEKLEVPLFISRRVLAGRQKLPRAKVPWVLDSGGFTELSLHGRWRLTTEQYADEVEEWAERIGPPDWVAPMDWMCEPHMIAKTGLSERAHQDNTLGNFLELRARLGRRVVPVLQGWDVQAYLHCLAQFLMAGVDVTQEPVVGIGSVCRRGQDRQIIEIVRELSDLGLSLHGFGVRGRALQALTTRLCSADSMAWSARARRDAPLPGHRHGHCGNCLDYAMRWRDQLVEDLLDVAY